MPATIQSVATVPASPPGAAAIVPVKSVADVYHHAARLLEEHGWVQNEWRDDAGRLCLSAALAEAATGWWGMALGMVDVLPPLCETDRDRLFVRAYHRLEAHLSRSPEEWNDKAARSAGEVTALLRAVAEHAALQPSPIRR